MDRPMKTTCWVLALWLGWLAATLPLDAAPFHFVQITDTHLGIAENDRRMQKIIAAVNALPMEIQCVVHTGDIYDRTVRKNPEAAAKAARILKGFRAPVLFLPGNNEIDLYSSPDPTRQAYTRQFGALTSSREVRGVWFILAYTDPLREGLAMDGYQPLDAIRQEMEKADGKPILLFHHGPSVADFYNNRLHAGWEENTREQWVALVNGYPVKGVIAGHFHRDEFHWLGQVPLYVAGPVAEKYGRQACFRIYEYDGGKLSYTAQYLE